MNSGVTSYGAAVCSTEVALSPAAASSDTSAASMSAVLSLAPEKVATATVQSEAQRMTSVRGSEAEDPVSYAIGLAKQIRAADSRLQGSCDAIIRTAAADPVTFAGGFTAGLGNGLFAAARNWLTSLLDMAKGAWDFLADSPLESTVAALVRGFAGLVALDVGKKENGPELLLVVATKLAELAGAGHDDEVSALMLVVSAQLTCVAEWLQLLRGASVESTLSTAVQMASSVVAYCVTELNQLAAKEPLELALALGETVGRFIGEITLIALGI